jgi:diaminopimelate decarboxylase
MAEIVIYPENIIERVRGLDALKERYDLKILFCVKSLAHAGAYDAVKHIFDGIEISNDRELLDPAAPLKVVNTLDEAEIRQLPVDDSYLISIDNVHMFNGFHSAPYLLRLNSTGWLGLEILKNRDLQGSRFGLEERDVESRMIEDVNFRGIHFHFGRFIDHSQNIHRRFLDKVHNRFGSDLAVIDIGGGQHHINDLDAIVEYARQMFPKADIYIEPGRWITQDCVIAETEVIRSTNRRDYKDLVLDLSYELHCKWSDAIYPLASYCGDVPVKLSGPTCFENDQFGFHKLDPANCELGARLELGGLTGYCVSFNHTFNGIAPAGVSLRQDTVRQDVVRQDTVRQDTVR